MFYDGWAVKARAADGTASIERTRRRFLLFDANYLHLNRPRGLWTWIADAYAGLLALLAVTGIFILRGRQGLCGRGKWLLLAGLAVPLLFLAAVRLLGSPPPTTGEGGRGRGRAVMQEGRGRARAEPAREEPSPAEPPPGNPALPEPR